MKSNSRRALQIILASVLLLMGCDISTFMSPQQIPTLIPGAIHLMVVQTAGAAATQTAALIPPTLTLTLTSFPTQTLINTSTVTPTFIFLLFTPTSVSDTATLSGTSCDDASYISDVTIPNHKVEAPGQTFVKTWMLQNIGSCTWDISYTLTFVSGNQMGGTNTSIGASVTPGQQAEVSVILTAPTTAGNYTGRWRLASDFGEVFGETIDVVINVNEDATATYGATMTPFNTPTPSNTPTPKPPTPTPTSSKTPRPKPPTATPK